MEEYGTKGIWEDFSVELQKFIARRISDKHDAEDILQEVFCKIHDHFLELKDTRKIHAWVYQITRNTIIDYYRTRRSLVQIENLPDLDLNKDFVNSEVYRELGICLKGMIQKLPEKYKVAIILTEFERLPQKELAKQLGLSVSGAKTRVQRARNKLRELMLTCCQIEYDRCGRIADFTHKRRTCTFCK